MSKRCYHSDTNMDTITYSSSLEGTTIVNGNTNMATKRYSSLEGATVVNGDTNMATINYYSSLEGVPVVNGGANMATINSSSSLEGTTITNSDTNISPTHHLVMVATAYLPDNKLSGYDSTGLDFIDSASEDSDNISDYDIEEMTVEEMEDTKKLFAFEQMKTSMRVLYFRSATEIS